MDTPDLTEGGTSCGKRYGTKTSISLIKKWISPTKENISIMANSMIQDKTTATQMSWPGFHDVLYMLAFTRQNKFRLHNWDFRF
jgi:copper homeostasis protein CutC